MNSIFLFFEAIEYIPFLFVAGLAVMFVSIVASAAKQKKYIAAKREEYARKVEQRSEQRIGTDANGIAERRRSYPRDLRANAAEQKSSGISPAQHAALHSHVGNTVVSNTDGHSHIGGTEEFYDASGGSLGDVSDEGCDDLKGVRVIANDLAYEATESTRDCTEIAKAMVLGQILNEPRFKKPYKKRG